MWAVKLRIASVGWGVGYVGEDMVVVAEDTDISVVNKLGVRGSDERGKSVSRACEGGDC